MVDLVDRGHCVSCDGALLLQSDGLSGARLAYPPSGKQLIRTYNP